MGKGSQGRKFESAVEPSDFVDAGSRRAIRLFAEEPVAEDGALMEPLSQGEKRLEDEGGGERFDDESGPGRMSLDPKSQKAKESQFGEFVEGGERRGGENNRGKKADKEDGKGVEFEFFGVGQIELLGGFYQLNEPEEEKKDGNDVGEVEGGDEVIDEDAGDVGRGEDKVLGEINGEKEKKKIEEAKLPGFKVWHINRYKQAVGII
jgi:hypothetical protein